MVDILISLGGVKTYFVHEKKLLGRPCSWVKAVDGVDLDIFRSECLGLAGESGCGKSTLGRTILRLAPVISGTIRFMGQAIQNFGHRAMRKIRPQMQMVFQDPRSALNPKMTVMQILTEALRINPQRNGKSDLESAVELLDMVDLRPEYLFRYPHEFSGGQQQRICIARALATRPKFIVFDESTSALDVSVQAQILCLMRQLQKKFDLTYLFISHDLGVLEQVCDRIAIMYAGKVVEVQEARTLFVKPRHPYTRELCNALPIADPDCRQVFNALDGEVPNLVNPPPGCPFHPRCRYRTEECMQRMPDKEFNNNHEGWFRCFHPLNVRNNERNMNESFVGSWRPSDAHGSGQCQ